ncbi:hypothetical protein [Hellea balneolensis]|uniref:hypothetical protein n=1 Tax=Hellea balneolensis TaxID=287478 RepID=UPI0003F9B5E8|nr:hypothetical protein [Hellea balneolensis]
MYRFIVPTLTALLLSSGAMAHPDPKTDVNTQAPVKLSDITPRLPDPSEIQEALKQMPDMNATMGEMMGIMKDERFRDNMENSARAFGDRLEDSGALETGKDGMPDFNNAFAVMLETFSDEEAMGGMMETMMGLAGTMEKHMPETAVKPALKAPETGAAPNLQDMQAEIDNLRGQVEQLRKEKAGH